MKQIHLDAPVVHLQKLRKILEDAKLVMMIRFYYSKHWLGSVPKQLHPERSYSFQMLHQERYESHLPERQLSSLVGSLLLEMMMVFLVGNLNLMAEVCLVMNSADMKEQPTTARSYFFKKVDG